MQRTPDETLSALELLAEEVKDLERRVRALENRPSEEGPRAPLPQPSIEPALAAPSPLSLGVIPVLGKAVLGIAGAYLLRAAAESGRLPGLAAVGGSAVYAAVWLGMAGRGAPREFARTIYSVAAGLMFFTMLWETTVRFRVLAPAGDVALMLGFILLGLVLAWSREMKAALWVTSLPAASTALVLMITTGDVTPFVAALLSISALVELASARGQWTGIRTLVAVIADLGVTLMVYVSTLPQQAEAYRAVPRAQAAWLCFVLAAIYAGGVGFRTAGRLQTIRIFDTLQMAVVFGLAVFAAIGLLHQPLALGICGLGLASVLYAAALKRFDPLASARNRQVYAAAGLALALAAGSPVLFPAAGTIFMAGLGLAMVSIRSRAAGSMLAAHGAVYLLAAAVASGFLNYAKKALIDTTLPAAPSGLFLTIGIAALAAYIACGRDAPRKWPRLALAAMAAFAGAAFLAVWLGKWIHVSAGPWLPPIRTAALCSMAVAAGGAGSRFGRAELVWTGYGAIALVTVKLFFQDFRSGALEALAVSLLCYGAVLIFGPRIIRSRR